MIRFDKSDRDVVVVCACGWRRHVASISIQASMVSADSLAMSHLAEHHRVDELERRRLMDTIGTRQRRRNTP